MSLNRRGRKAFVWILIVLVILAAGIYFAYQQEKTVSPDITFIDVVENTIIAMLGEYPDKPHSLIARGLQLLWFAFSVVIFGLVVGKISSLFITYSLKQRDKMKSFENHIVICNWNKRGEEIIQQLLEAQNKDVFDIVVLSGAAIDLSEFKISDDKRQYLHFIQDDPTQHCVLMKINAQKAKSIIILADDKSESPDEKSVLIALAVKHLERDLNKDLHVVAELVNPGLKRHLVEAGADEVVCSMSYNSGIIAQSALFKKMSEIYQRLLTYSNDTNEIYFQSPSEYSSEYIGKSFEEIAELINQKRFKEKENPVILLGVKHGDEILMNPKSSEFSVLEKGDYLITMAYNHAKNV